VDLSYSVATGIRSSVLVGGNMSAQCTRSTDLRVGQVSGPAVSTESRPTALFESVQKRRTASGQSSFTCIVCFGFTSM